MKMKTLGNNIKSLRKERRLTLIAVSQATKIDPATLSRIENGHMTGTLESHMAIAKALNVHLPDLYDKALDAESTEAVSKKTDSSGVFAHSGGSVSEILTSNVLQKKMMPTRLKLKGGHKTAEEEFSLGTERYVYALEGKVEVVIKGQSHNLTAGESLYYNASAPHYFVNKLKSLSVCLVLTTPPAL